MKQSWSLELRHSSRSWVELHRFRSEWTQRVETISVGFLDVQSRLGLCNYPQLLVTLLGRIYRKAVRQETD